MLTDPSSAGFHTSNNSAVLPFLIRSNRSLFFGFPCTFQSLFASLDSLDPVSRQGRDHCMFDEHTGNPQIKQLAQGHPLKRVLSSFLPSLPQQRERMACSAGRPHTRKEQGTHMPSFRASAFRGQPGQGAKRVPNSLPCSAPQARRPGTGLHLL